MTASDGTREARETTPSELAPGEGPGRRLAGLVVAQFLGAFNDNAWKLIVAVIAVEAARRSIPDPAAQEAAEFFRTTLSFSLLTAALAAASLPAMYLADRVSKRSLIVWMKAVELGLMVAATAVMLIAPTAWPVMLAVIALMGVQSGIFGPAKYGVLPELLPHAQLSRGNGLMEMWTFLAIILGTAAGPGLLWLAGRAGGGMAWLAPAGLVVLAVIGLVAATRIPRVAPGAGGAATGFGEVLRGAAGAIWRDRILFLAVVGSVLYWGFASYAGQCIFVAGSNGGFAQELAGWFGWTVTPGMAEAVSGVPLAVVGVGAGIGAAAAGRISGPRVEYGLIPLGGAGLAVSMIVLGAWGPGAIWAAVLLVLMGFSGGLIVVPLAAIQQWRAPQARRGAVIALANVFVFSGVLAGSFAAWGMAELLSGLSATGSAVGPMLVAAGLAMAGATAWACWLMPEALARFVVVALVQSGYRLRILGRRHVPERGPVLLAPNHVSYIDGLVMIASLDRPIRFIVDRVFYNEWWAKPFMKALGAIPIDATGGPRVVMRALKDAGRYLESGEVVGVFPEGQLTRTGMMMPFRRGFERVVRGRDAAIVPAYLDGVWGSIFSYDRGRFVFKRPRRLPYPITVNFGEPLPPDATAMDVRLAVQNLSEEAWRLRDARRVPLHRMFLRTARRRPRRWAFGDDRTPRLRALPAAAGALLLARQLRDDWAGQRRVGIMLPPSVGATLANLAASLAGRVSVNLNFTLGRDSLASACRQAELKTVVTTREFLDRASVTLPDELRVIPLDEVAARITPTQRVLGALAARLLPMGWLERLAAPRGGYHRITAEDPVTVIFSSGSTGEPKGVVLSHRNIAANVEGVAETFPLRDEDRLLGVLPLFHSFGYMSTWLGAIQGMPIRFSPNPLDAETVGKLVEWESLTLLIATPTFLQMYLRRVAPGQFGSLRVVLTGAEKLPRRVAEQFREKFGLNPIEGYGATECAPVVAISTVDVRQPRIFQQGSRRGAVGAPLHGVGVRIVDPVSFQPLPPDQPGMLLVRGPNVMLGYLDRPDLTEQVMHEGWYITGDVARMDELGFLEITDRLSRFSKIAGEMVPHGRIEEALHDAAGTLAQGPTFAVTAVPDDRKGERLAVLHTLAPDRIPAILDKLRDMGLPALFIPAEKQFHHVDALPLLGSGKLDLRSLKAEAARREAG